MKNKTNKTDRVTRRTTPAERAKLIREYYASGLSRRDFAVSRGINHLTFHSWFRTKELSHAQNETTGKFVKIELAENAGRRVELVTECTSGVRVHISGLDVREAAVFIREVNAC
jgi:transposase-like protein